MKGVKEYVDVGLREVIMYVLTLVSGSNNDTPCVFPGSPSFRMWHRPPPRLIGFIFFTGTAFRRFRILGSV